MAGIGTVFIVGVLISLLGVPLMVAWRMRDPSFLRRETVPPERSRLK